MLLLRQGLIHYIIIMSDCLKCSGVEAPIPLDQTDKN